MAPALRRQAAIVATSFATILFRSTVRGCAYCGHRGFRITTVGAPPPRSLSAFVPAKTFNTDTSAVASETCGKIIDGNSVAKEIRDKIALDILRIQESAGLVPGLAVILVGGRKDSVCYVENKRIACETVGIKSFEVFLSEDTSEKEVINYISGFNQDPLVNGILVQLPLPSHVNEQNVLNSICIEKDVDGFNPLNIGLLAMLDREPLFVPCTPKGCLELLHRYGIVIEGKRAVVLGRSNIVGLPAALLLQKEHATVTVIQPGMKNPEEIIREADILISAVGQPYMVRGSWIKPGSVIIDVGTNPVEDNTSPRGYRLVGDVCYEEARKIAFAITPVPGGVGPMTIAMLLSNTLLSFKRANQCFQSITEPANSRNQRSWTAGEGTKNW